MTTKYERKRYRILAQTKVSSPQAAALLPLLHKLPLDGMLRWDEYTLYYASFKRGHDQYRLVHGVKVIGVHLVRSPHLLPLIHVKLADLLAEMGATRTAVRLYEYAPLPCNAEQYRFQWLFPDHKRWMREAV